MRKKIFAILLAVMASTLPVNALDMSSEFNMESFQKQYDQMLSQNSSFSGSFNMNIDMPSLESHELKVPEGWNSALELPDLSSMTSEIENSVKEKSENSFGMSGAIGSSLSEDIKNKFESFSSTMEKAGTDFDQMKKDLETQDAKSKNSLQDFAASYTGYDKAEAFKSLDGISAESFFEGFEHPQAATVQAKMNELKNSKGNYDLMSMFSQVYGVGGPEPLSGNTPDLKIKGALSLTNGALSMDSLKSDFSSGNIFGGSTATSLKNANSVNFSKYTSDPDKLKPVGSDLAQDRMSKAETVYDSLKSGYEQ